MGLRLQCLFLREYGATTGCNYGNFLACLRMVRMLSRLLTSTFTSVCHERCPVVYIYTIITNLDATTMNK